MLTRVNLCLLFFFLPQASRSRIKLVVVVVVLVGGEGVVVGVLFTMVKGEGKQEGKSRTRQCFTYLLKCRH